MLSFQGCSPVHRRKWYVIHGATCETGHDAVSTAGEDHWRLPFSVRSGSLRSQLWSVNSTVLIPLPSPLGFPVSFFLLCCTSFLSPISWMNVASFHLPSVLRHLEGCAVRPAQTSAPPAGVRAQPRLLWTLHVAPSYPRARWKALHSASQSMGTSRSPSLGRIPSFLARILAPWLEVQPPVGSASRRL